MRRCIVSRRLGERERKWFLVVLHYIRFIYIFGFQPNQRAFAAFSVIGALALLPPFQLPLPSLAHCRRPTKQGL